MMSIKQDLTGRMAKVSGRVLVYCLVIGGLCLAAGCGSRYIMIDLERPVELKQPVWVGVYFLSQETALDDLENHELTDPDGVELGGAVVYKEVYSLYPGDEARPIKLEKYDESIRWIVVAAGIADPQECARWKKEVEEGAKLKIAMTVDDQCISVVID